MPKLYCKSLENEIKKNKSKIRESLNKLPNAVKLELPPGSLQNTQKRILKHKEHMSGVISPIPYDNDSFSVERDDPSRLTKHTSASRTASQR